ncbi:serine hydrolase [Inquilinus sp. NPDC058860]|uniref:serine hydrolase n=1 Tax=Inquilinus sp. NPDC058860 TaxID=3346652 RepID=UPI0036C7BC6C
MKTWTITGPEVPALARFDQAMRAYMTQHDVRAGSIAITKDDRLVFSRGYTWGDPDYPVTRPNSVFRIASCSKPLTSIAIYQLVEKGLMGLDDKAQAILNLKTPAGTAPALDPKPNSDNQPGHYWPAVTIRHLLGHRGGWNRDINGHNDPVNRDVEVAAAFGRSVPVTKYDVASFGVAQPLQFWPGTDSHYSNFGYSILGLVIEKKTGKPYEQALLESVFVPVGVGRPRIAFNRKEERAKGEVFYHDAAERTGPSMLEPSQPMVEFPYGAENFRNYDSFGGWVLAAPDYARVLSQFSRGSDNPLLKTPIGKMLGWQQVTSGGTTYGHGGVMPGTASAVIYRPDGLSITVLWNKNGPATLAFESKTINHADLWQQLLDEVKQSDWPAHDLFHTEWGLSDWHGWYGLGGSIVDAPAVVVYGPDAHDIYVRGTDDRLWQKWWDGKRWNPSDEGWAPHDDGGFRLGSAPAVIARGNDFRDVYVRGQDGKVYHKYWNGKTWTGWFGLGGSIVGAPAVVVYGPDAHDIYAQGTDGRLWQKWWDGKRWNPSDEGWAPHEDGGFRLGSAPAAIAEGKDFRDVYVRGQDGKVYHKYWNGKTWTGWFGLGGSIIGAPSVVVYGPDAHDIYVQGTDGRLWQKFWDGKRWHPSDEGWSLHDDGGFRLGSSPSVIAEGAGFRDVYVRGKDGRIYHKYWNGK